MTRADDVRNILVLEAFAEQARTAAKMLRGQLEADARRMLETEGTAPTWRLPDIAHVTLPLSRETVAVCDPDKLLEWVRLRHPAEVEEVREDRVRASFVTALTGAVDTTDGVPVDRETGEIVPGLEVRRGGQPRSLTIKVEPAIKAQIAARAAAALPGVFGELEAAPEVPQLEATVAAGDPFALFPPTAQPADVPTAEGGEA